jgi:hypothetical protein
VDYFPQTYGERVIPLALQILASQSAPPAAYTDHVLVTAENVHRLYPEDATSAPANGLTMRVKPASPANAARRKSQIVTMRTS